MNIVFKKRTLHFDHIKCDEKLICKDYTNAYNVPNVGKIFPV